jgi:hypothetical protein
MRIIRRQFPRAEVKVRFLRRFGARYVNTEGGALEVFNKQWRAHGRPCPVTVRG